MKQFLSKEEYGEKAARKLTDLLIKKNRVSKEKACECTELSRDNFNIILSVMDTFEIFHFEIIEGEEVIVWDGYKTLKTRAMETAGKLSRKTNVFIELEKHNYSQSTSASYTRSVCVLSTRVLEYLLGNVHRTVNYADMMAAMFESGSNTLENKEMLKLVGDIMAGSNILWAWNGTMFTWNDTHENEEITSFLLPDEERDPNLSEDDWYNDDNFETSMVIETAEVSKKAFSSRNNKPKQMKKRKGKGELPAAKKYKTTNTFRKKRRRDETTAIGPPLKVQKRANNRKCVNNNNKTNHSIKKAIINLEQQTSPILVENDSPSSSSSTASTASIDSNGSTDEKARRDQIIRAGKRKRCKTEKYLYYTSSR